MTTAKEFLITSSTKFEEAVANGYDIRMEEQEILQWMEAYAQHKNRVTEKYYLDAFKFIDKELEKYFPDKQMLHGFVVKIIETNTIPF